MTKIMRMLDELKPNNELRKALQIILDKGVDVTMLYNNYNDYEGYLAEEDKYYKEHNIGYSKEEWFKEWVLTKEEFDLLNDMLFDEDEK